jgi:hypothetical protein
LYELMLLLNPGGIVFRVVGPQTFIGESVQFGPVQKTNPWHTTVVVHRLEIRLFPPMEPRLPMHFPYTSSSDAPLR